MTTIKTVKDLISHFCGVKLWLYANDSTEEKPPTVLVRGINNYQIESAYPQYLECEVVDFDMGEDGLNIFIESPAGITLNMTVEAAEMLKLCLEEALNSSNNTRVEYARMFINAINETEKDSKTKLKC